MQIPISPGRNIGGSICFVFVGTLLSTAIKSDHVQITPDPAGWIVTEKKIPTKGQSQRFFLWEKKNVFKKRKQFIGKKRKDLLNISEPAVTHTNMYTLLGRNDKRPVSFVLAGRNVLDFIPSKLNRQEDGILRDRWIRPIDSKTRKRPGRVLVLVILSFPSTKEILYLSRALSFDFVKNDTKGQNG